jgi:purine-nucleoside phosphorylase
MGSGMGVPSATLYVHELFSFYGVETVLRIGSAGGIGETVKLRDLVIAMTASTNSSYVAQYQFPGQLSPQADYELLRTAAELAERKGINVRVGSVFTADMFYNKNDNAADNTATWAYSPSKWRPPESTGKPWPPASVLYRC